MKNKDLNGSRPLLASSEFGDDDDLAATAVLNKTAIMDRESLQDESDAFLDETVRMDRGSFMDDAEGILDSTVSLGDSFSATDNVGDVSVEINVEELIADIETKGDKRRQSRCAKERNPPAPRRCGRGSGVRGYLRDRSR